MFNRVSFLKKTPTQGLRIFRYLSYKCRVMNKVIKQMSFVRDGNQPPTFPTLRAAPAHHGHPVPMKNLRRILLAGLPAMALATAGCKAAVSVSGSFATPREIVTGTIQTTTNAVTVGGTYQAGTTNLGGSVTVGK
jgi:hypothetical protein